MNEKRKAYYKRVRDRIEAEKHNICVSFLNLPEANSNYFAYRYAIKEKIEAVQRYMGLQTQFSFERDVNMIFPVKGKMLLFFKSEIQKIFFLNRYHKISLQIPPSENFGGFQGGGSVKNSDPSGACGGLFRR